VDGDTVGRDERVAVLDLQRVDFGRGGGVSDGHVAYLIRRVLAFGSAVGGCGFADYFG
jgi:hypothetical protein